MNPPKFYLAGPFFNPAQLELQQQIEVAFIDHGVPYFSPRQCEENDKKVLTTEDADVIFKRNVENLPKCDALLAVLDWKMPVDESIRKVKILHDEIRVQSGPLNLPDSGTVFEMGWIHGYNYCNNPRHPIIGFTTRQRSESLNLMISKACDGIISGLDELAKFLNYGRIQWEIAKPWQGRNV